MSKEILKLNHSTNSFDAYRSMQTNPYGKINAYVSRTGGKCMEKAVYGQGFYTMRGWSKYFMGYRYTIYLMVHPGKKLTPVTNDYFLPSGNDIYVVGSPTNLKIDDIQSSNHIASIFAGQLGFERRILINLAADCSWRTARSTERKQIGTNLRGDSQVASAFKTIEFQELNYCN